MSTIVFIATFFYCYIYAVTSWGLLLGLGLGWVPSLVVASIAAATWPALFWIIGIAALLIAVFSL